jgi:hypothetical protein
MRPGGILNIALWTDDVEGTAGELKRKGVEFARRTPDARLGARKLHGFCVHSNLERPLQQILAAPLIGGGGEARQLSEECRFWHDLEVDSRTPSRL